MSWVLGLGLEKIEPDLKESDYQHYYFYQYYISSYTLIFESSILDKVALGSKSTLW